MNFKLNIQLFGNAVIPFDNGRNDKRDIEGLWLQALATSKALTAAIGCEFGSVLNIQDVGQKEQGKVYLDKNNGKLYKCLNTTTSVSNTTENFALFNVQQNSDRLDNLSEIYEKILSYGVHAGKTINIPNKYQNICIRCANSSGGSPSHEAHDYRILPTSFDWILRFRILGATGDYISNSVEFLYNSSTRNLLISNITGVGIEIKGMYFG